jgi:hypothetical protein
MAAFAASQRSVRLTGWSTVPHAGSDNMRRERQREPIGTDLGVAGS